jgi:prevent-host-death family protein
VDEVGLREMRQQASELVRRAESGERLVITVSGRPAAMLGPVAASRWRRWAEVAEIFGRPGVGSWGEQDWHHEDDQLEGAVEDPWERR